MTSPAHHNDVGAYAIGALDAVDSARFEEHLAVCQPCGQELDELLGLGPLLAEYSADVPGGVAPVPSEGMLERLLHTVGAARRRRRTRHLALAAVAAVVIVAGPIAGATVLGDSSPPSQPVAADPVRTVFDAGTKLESGPSADGVAATVSWTEKRWGTEVAVRLAGVTGPETCGLIAVGKDGSEQTVTTWAVPAGGYGPSGPVYYVGGAAYGPGEIERFEVRTLDGERLATIPT